MLDEYKDLYYKALDRGIDKVEIIFGLSLRLILATADDEDTVRFDTILEWLLDRLT